MLNKSRKTIMGASYKRIFRIFRETFDTLKSKSTRFVPYLISFLT